MTIQLNLTSTWVSLKCSTTAEIEGFIATICRVEVPDYYHVGCFRYKDAIEIAFPLNPSIQRIGNELEITFIAKEKIDVENLEVEIISW